MAEKICAAAVDAATYAIDKLYSYRVPDELREQVQIGTRVLVPFGFGNKRAEAVVLAFREDAGEFKLKPIVEVLDETPILTAEQLKRIIQSSLEHVMQDPIVHIVLIPRIPVRMRHYAEAAALLYLLIYPLAVAVFKSINA